MMQCRRIFEYAKIRVVARRAESGRLRPVDADLLAGFGAVLQETGLEGGVRPCFGDQARARSRTDGFGPFGEFPVVLRGEEAMLDRKLSHGDLKNLIVGYFFHHRRGFVLVAVAGVAMLVRRAHGRPLCLFRSRSVSNGVEPMIREFGLQRIVVERVLLPEILLTES